MRVHILLCVSPQLCLRLQYNRHCMIYISHCEKRTISMGPRMSRNILQRQRILQEAKNILPVLSDVTKRIKIIIDLNVRMWCYWFQVAVDNAWEGVHCIYKGHCWNCIQERYSKVKTENGKWIEYNILMTLTKFLYIGTIKCRKNNQRKFHY